MIEIDKNLSMKLNENQKKNMKQLELFGEEKERKRII